jgi:4-amino-4-deoxy-L-arabinose transferase-like glycosyltransferase
VTAAPGAVKLALAGTILAALVATAAGVTRSLPLTPDIDEPTFVGPALHIAATGNLNPGWFGHPGATVIYPLALLFKLMGSTPMPDQYLAGRWLTIAYEVAAIPLVFLVGRTAFGALAGVVGAWLTAILPIAVAHAQVVRTDSAAIFFGMLSLWLCLRSAQQPTRTRVVLAGLGIGLAIATRYFMVALVPILVASVWRRAPLAVLGVAAVALGFVIASPYAVLDFPALRTSLAGEAETSHLGADGLSPPGNLLWYVTTALPSDLTWPVVLLAALGVGLSLWRRTPRHLLLLAYVVVFLVLISASALHWHRWTIQVLPVLALFAGSAVQHLASVRVAVACVAAASIQLVAQLALFDLQQLQPSPRVLARQWLVDHPPPGGTVVVQELYGPPLDGTRITSRARASLAEQRLVDYGSSYLVASSAVYDRYFAEAARYPGQVAFYEELFGRGRLLAEFRARAPGADVLLFLSGAECNCSLHPTRGAPALRIYAVGALS